MSRVKPLFVMAVLCGLVSHVLAQEIPPQQQAVDKGVKFFRSLQQADGSWPHPEKVGMTALAGLTLLECGVAKDDPVLVKAGALVRQGAVQLTHTYSLAQSMIFLDKLAGPADPALIQSMAARLVTGQNKFGGWSYHCPAPSPQEVDRLKKVLEKPGEVADKRVLPPEIQQELIHLQKVALAFGNPTGLGDTSNTAFATMGLEMARQYGFPVEKSLQLVEMRFLQSQNMDGGWSYTPDFSPVMNATKSSFVYSQKQVLQTEKLLGAQYVGSPEYQILCQFGLRPFFVPNQLLETPVERSHYHLGVLYYWKIQPFGDDAPYDYYPPNVFYFNKMVNPFLANTFVGEKKRYVPTVLKNNPPPTPDRGPNKRWAVVTYVVHGIWRPVKEISTRIEIEEKIRPFNPLLDRDENFAKVKSQGQTGTLTFYTRFKRSTPSCTSDTLLTLALSRSLNPLPKSFNGLSTEAIQIIRERITNTSLLALGNIIGQPKANQNPVPKIQEGENTFYYLWSLNQMNNSFGLTSLGQKNWHGWGEELLITNQKEDGSWQGIFKTGGADTCFALLFLRRSNWVPQVTEKLKGKVRDPGLEFAKIIPGTPNKSLANKMGEKEAEAFCLLLAKASPGQRKAFINRMRDTPGEPYLNGLALGIPKLKDDTLQNDARFALAQRLSMNVPEVLRPYLKSDNAEIRQAACTGCQLQMKKENVPFLIPLLLDDDPGVAAAAQRGLARLSGQNFGPSPEATLEDRQTAMARWSQWWEESQNKKP